MNCSPVHRRSIGARQTDRMARILIASGGPPYAHDHAAAAEALTTLLNHAGHEIVAVTTHPRELPAALVAAAPELIVMHMLWWRMLADRYDDLRADWAYASTPGVRASIEGFVRRGGGLVALHTSTICFDDWAEWGDLLGAQWNWARSFHPPLGPVGVRFATVDHPLTRGLDDFATTDEVYANLDIRPDVEPLAWGRHLDGSEHPVLWLRPCGDGRVAHLGIGHDAGAIRQPTTTELIWRSVAWAVGSDEASSDG